MDSGRPVVGAEARVCRPTARPPADGATGPTETTGADARTGLNLIYLNSFFAPGILRDD
jgi:hypothetical protein